MAPVARATTAQMADLMDDTQHRITNVERFFFQPREVDIFNLADAVDLGGGVLWNETKSRLGASERRLPVEVALRAILVRPDLPNFRVAEHIAKYYRVDRTGWHLKSPIHIGTALRSGEPNSIAP